MLRLMLDYLNLHVVVSQIVAVSSYTLLMYSLTRFFVFSANKISIQQSELCGA